MDLVKMEKTPQSAIIDKSMKNFYNGKETKIQVNFNPISQRWDIAHSPFSWEKF